MGKNKGDKLVLGNSMQSLSALLDNQPAAEGEVKMVFSQQSIVDHMPEAEKIVLGEPSNGILDEAIATVKAMSPEQLLSIGNAIADELVTITNESLGEEPDHHGDTSHGLSPKWIDWYCAVNSCRVWKAIAEGKRRLRAAKETPKRRKRVPNPK